MPLHLEPVPASLCKLGRFLATADPDDASTVQSWLDDPAISDLRTASSLTRSGYKVGPGVVWGHRTGVCCCG